MRFKVNLKTYKYQNLSFNYQNPLSTAIYEKISSSNSQYGSWLHETGFQNEELPGYKHKGFCFSNLRNLKYDFIKGEKYMVVHPCEFCFYISFAKDEITEHFIKGIFTNESFVLNGFYTEITSIEVLPYPVFNETMSFRTLSPIFIRHGKYERGQHNEPHPILQGDAYRKNLAVGLGRKFKALHGVENGFEDFEMKLLSKPVGRLITIKNTTWKAYDYGFEIKADVDLIKAGYDSGFGQLASQGFGYCETLNILKQLNEK